MQVNSFSCAHMGHQGRLMVSPSDIYFVSTPYRVDLLWSQITEISMETKRIQGKPTTVIIVKSNGVSQPHIFSNFRDVNSAEQQLQKYLARSRSAADQPMPANQRANSDEEVRDIFSSAPVVQPVPMEILSPKPARRSQWIGAALILVLLMFYCWPFTSTRSIPRRLSQLQTVDGKHEEASAINLENFATGTAILSAVCLIVVGFHFR